MAETKRKSMGKKNPIEDANLLYVALIIIVVIISTVVIVDLVFNGEENTPTYQTEKVLSNLQVNPLSSNEFEVSLQITNKGCSTVERKNFHFYWENERVEPNLFSRENLCKGEECVIKLENRTGELKIFYKGRLIYSHNF